MKRTALIGIGGTLAVAVAAWAVGTILRDPAAAMPQTEGEAHSPVVAIARGEVDVDGGLVRIVALRSGQLAEVKAREGDEVTLGQILATLDSRSSQLQVDSARAGLAAAQARARLLQVRQALAQRQAVRVEQAAADNAASPQALDEAREAAASFDAEIASTQAAVQSATTQMAAAQLDLEARTLRAPVAGRIVARLATAHPSLTVPEGTELFVLLPHAQRVVRAQIDEDFASQIQVGMLAEIRPNSDQGPGYPAKVLRVGEVLRQRSMDTANDQRHDVRVLDCLLSITEPDLRIGQPVLVRFLRRG